jgi:hypothetical protein
MDLLGPDPTGSLGQLSPDIVWTVPGSPELGGGRYEGLPQVGDFLLQVLALFRTDCAWTGSTPSSPALAVRSSN